MTPPAIHPFLMGLLRGSHLEAVEGLTPTNGEWEEVVRDAVAEGLVALLYGWLRGSAMHRRLPLELADHLEGEFFALAARNLILAAELQRVLRALEEQRVPCAPLRGLALAERLYGDIAARPMGDLDLLVRKEDLPHMAVVLRGLGFREMDRRPGFAEAFSYTLEFVKDRHGWIIVEPHWTITYPPFVDRVDMGEVWKRCVRGPVVGVETWLLGREELLLHLCLHLAHKDGAAPLLWSYEIDRFVRQQPETFDWSRFLSLARESTLESLLSQILGAVKEVFATPIPDRIFDQLTLQPRRSMEGRLVRLLATRSNVDGRETLALLFTLRGIRAKLRYALALLFPSPEFMRLHYGLTRRSQTAVAYVGRLCYLSWGSLKGLVELLIAR